MMGKWKNGPVNGGKNGKVGLILQGLLQMVSNARGNGSECGKIMENGSLWLWTNLFLNQLEYMETLKVEKLKFMKMRPQTLGFLEKMMKK